MARKKVNQVEKAEPAAGEALDFVSEAEKGLQKLRQEKNGLARFGWVTKDGTTLQVREPCHYKVNRLLDHITAKHWKTSLFFTVFGDTSGGQTYQEEYKSTKKSIALAQYFTSPDGPWHPLLPFIVNTDPEYISENGLIFRNLPEIPAKLLFNLCIASRLTIEWPEVVKRWWDFVKDGIDPRRAMLIAMGWVQDGKQGPWQPQVLGGHHHLTGFCDKYAYRYTCGKPQWPEDQDIFAEPSAALSTMYFEVKKSDIYDAYRGQPPKATPTFEAVNDLIDQAVARQRKQVGE